MRHQAPAATYIALLVFTGVLASCRNPSLTPEPTLEITRVPNSSQGSSDRLEDIEGRATGAKPGQQIVLYARSGVWWVQPFAQQPFTPLEKDFTWKGKTHPGTAYAAMLVEAGYPPRMKTGALPGKGGGVVAVVEALGTASNIPPRTLSFGGYEWDIRQTSYGLGGTDNLFGADNAWIDKQGHLHLQITGAPEHWTSAEVKLHKSPGYGSYRFTVRELAHLEPSAVFSMRTWDETASREMDIEVSKWGELQNRNGQFVVQPYHVPANTVQFQLPSGRTTFLMHWSPGRADVQASQKATVIKSHAFTSGIPAAGKESVDFNLYVFGFNNNPLRKPTEVVVENFEYIP